jgi:hypothetical protein
VRARGTAPQALQEFAREHDPSTGSRRRRVMTLMLIVIFGQRR